MPTQREAPPTRETVKLLGVAEAVAAGRLLQIEEHRVRVALRLLRWRRKRLKRARDVALHEACSTFSKRTSDSIGTPVTRTIFSARSKGG